MLAVAGGWVRKETPGFSSVLLKVDLIDWT